MDYTIFVSWYFFMEPGKLVKLESSILLEISSRSFLFRHVLVVQAALGLHNAILKWKQGKVFATLPASLEEPFLTPPVYVNCCMHLCVCA